MNQEVRFVSDTAADSIQTELFLSDAKELNVFYDIRTDDSSLYCLDFYNDTILKYIHGHPRLPSSDMPLKDKAQTTLSCLSSLVR